MPHITTFGRKDEKHARVEVAPFLLRMKEEGTHNIDCSSGDILFSYIQCAHHVSSARTCLFFVCENLAWGLERNRSIDGGSTPESSNANHGKTSILDF
jgi:hypothetical protein